jgi:hypothetical protein
MADFLRNFPNLANAQLSIKSPLDDSYQCIAWAECHTDRRSWPSHYGSIWPQGMPLADPPEEAPVDYFVQRFSLLGYTPCYLDDKFEIGYQKVAIYANDIGVTHMARQHFFGRGWLSKAGDLEDILLRNLCDLEGDMSPLARTYGKVQLILKRTWWSALIHLCVFRCMLNSCKFWLSRMMNKNVMLSKTGTS